MPNRKPRHRPPTPDRPAPADPVEKRAAGAPIAAAAALPHELQLGLAGGGQLRWVAVDITTILREVTARLDLSPVAAAALGRSVAGAAMLLRLATKTPSRLVLDIRGDGPLGRVVVEIDQDGNIRSMVGAQRVEVPDLPGNKLAVGRAVGAGLLRVLREFGDGASYHSHVELVNGEIGDDIAHYLRQSEQTDSAVLVGVLGRTDGIAAAGGVIVQALPGATEAVLARLEANLAGIAGVSWLLADGGIEHALDLVLAGLDRKRIETAPLRYRCRCSRERLLQHLVLLSADDRDYLAEEDGTIAADCVFCGNRYRFTPEELQPSVQ